MTYERVRLLRGAGVAVAACLALAACGGGKSAAPTTTTSTTLVTTSTTVPASTTSTQPRPTTTTAAPQVTMPNGDPVFDGYPKLVEIGSVDDRVASWYGDDAPTGQLVALAPGVYTPYNPNVTDLNSYLDGPNSGDCAARKKYFPNTGGACWEGVS